MNYAARISYVGKNYFGWQVQPDALSVQEVIEDQRVPSQNHRSRTHRQRRKRLGAGCVVQAQQESRAGQAAARYELLSA